MVDNVNFPFESQYQFEQYITKHLTWQLRLAREEIHDRVCTAPFSFTQITSYNTIILEHRTLSVKAIRQEQKRADFIKLAYKRLKRELSKELKILNRNLHLYHYSPLNTSKFEQDKLHNRFIRRQLRLAAKQFLKECGINHRSLQQNDISISKYASITKLNRGCQNPQCLWTGSFIDRQLHFHHKDSTTKTATISHMVRQRGIYTEDEIMDEIDKCIVLCANCHAAVHYEHKQLKAESTP